jgi:hypothetical protein
VVDHVHNLVLARNRNRNHDHHRVTVFIVIIMMILTRKVTDPRDLDRTLAHSLTLTPALALALSHSLALDLDHVLNLLQKTEMLDSRIDHRLDRAINVNDRTTINRIEEGEEEGEIEDQESKTATHAETTSARVVRHATTSCNRVLYQKSRHQ